MPIKYIGRTTDFCGKPLWEILGNLRNFGVGRLVRRQMFERYPEPCFFRILKVETVPVEEGTDRKVRAWVEKVFRGKRYPNVVELYEASYKADYRLVPKSEEAALWERVNQVKHQDRILPERIPFPPLLSEMIKEEMKQNGEPDAEPMLKLQVRRGRDNFFKVASESEVPNVKIHDFSSKLYEIKQ